jgi:hypothetical protein
MMGKLYFRKLVKGFKYVAVCMLVYVFGANVLVTIANFFKEVPILQLLVVMGIPGLVSWFWASVKRSHEKELGRAYKKEMGDAAGNFKDELTRVLTSRDYRAELLSGFTYALLISAWLTLPGSMPALPIRLINCLIYFVMIAVAYALGDLLSWLWVNSKFRKDDLL